MNTITRQQASDEFFRTLCDFAERMQRNGMYFEEVRSVMGDQCAIKDALDEVYPLVDCSCGDVIRVGDRCDHSAQEI